MLSDNSGQTRWLLYSQLQMKMTGGMQIIGTSKLDNSLKKQPIMTFSLFTEGEENTMQIVKDKGQNGLIKFPIPYKSSDNIRWRVY